MTKQLLKLIFYILIFTVPTILNAQPTFSGGICDSCVPIDQQTLMLASGGVIYAIHKIRESRKK